MNPYEDIARRSVEKKARKAEEEQKRLRDKEAAFRHACSEMSRLIVEVIEPEFILAQEGCDRHGLEWRYEISEPPFGKEKSKFKASIVMKNQDSLAMSFSGDPERKAFDVKETWDTGSSSVSLGFHDVTCDRVQQRVRDFFERVLL